MTSQPPPSLGAPAGVPPGGNTKYVLLALLLLGAIALLTLWQRNRSITPEVAAPRDVIDAGVGYPKRIAERDDEIPPPPPVIEAGAPVAERKTPGPQTAGPVCSAACTGSTTPELETALAFRAKQAHRCYDNALAQDSTLKGKVGITLRIAANGGVCSSTVSSDELSTPTVANCVAGFFRGASFPVPRGGCVEVNVPVNFVPR